MLIPINLGFNCLNSSIHSSITYSYLVKISSLKKSLSSMSFLNTRSFSKKYCLSPCFSNSLNNLMLRSNTLQLYPVFSNVAFNTAGPTVGASGLILGIIQSSMSSIVKYFFHFWKCFSKSYSSLLITQTQKLFHFRQTLAPIFAFHKTENTI